MFHHFATHLLLIPRSWSIMSTFSWHSFSRREWEATIFSISSACLLCCLLTSSCADTSMDSRCEVSSRCWAVNASNTVVIYHLSLQYLPLISWPDWVLSRPRLDCRCWHLDTWWSSLWFRERRTSLCLSELWLARSDSARRISWDISCSTALERIFLSWDISFLLPCMHE